MLTTETITRYDFTDVTPADMLVIGLIAAKKIDEITLGNDAITCIMALIDPSVSLVYHTAEESYNSHAYISLAPLDLEGDSGELFIELYDDGTLLFYDGRVPGATFDADFNIANIQAELEGFGLV